MLSGTANKEMERKTVSTCEKERVIELECAYVLREKLASKDTPSFDIII